MKSPVFENTDLQIYVHYPGKLMQALKNPIFTSKFYKYQWDNTLEMKLLQVRLWRKRTDSANACKSEIMNDDLYLQRIISNQFGCSPANIRLLRRYRTNGPNSKLFDNI